MPDTAPSETKHYFAWHVFVCCNRRPDGHTRGSCAASGSEALRDYMKAKAKELRLPSTRINAAGCLDRCELGPCVVIYPEGVWFRAASREDIDAILVEHVLGGDPLDRLRLPSRPPDIDGK